MLRYLDVPSSELHRLDPSRSQPDTVFVVPRDLASQAQTIGAVPPADIIRFSERAALAAASGAHRSTITSTLNQKDNDMADLRLMRDSFKEMDDNLDQIVLNLPEERAKQIKSLRDKVTNSQRLSLIHI